MILIGSFLVPVTFVAFAFRRNDAVITAQRVFGVFLYGGALGVLGASVLHPALSVHVSGWACPVTALIEEAAKLAALWLIARHLPIYRMRDGMMLGATMGFSFAAFESTGYAFHALFTSSGLPLPNLIEAQALRAVLVPVGHGLWTAVLGGVLFATASRTSSGRPRLRLPVVGYFIVVAVLQTLWDASQAIAGWLTSMLTDTTAQWMITSEGELPRLKPTQVPVFTVLSWGLLVQNVLIGLTLLLHWLPVGRTPATPTAVRAAVEERT
ncbi:PrsW family glutamic-type intramembrane protease [Nonomuraea turcica]|uniref:PrsW family glutamic-type intramembrane protease n=1 Tax=Nonomuraea sp. G32 TaxID=3067274 RepID=UPI00273CE507|nr:PrsW family glutamic-type intramembrane protease [Nonomuraea sp. G32]